MLEKTYVVHNPVPGGRGPDSVTLTEEQKQFYDKMLSAWRLLKPSLIGTNSLGFASFKDDNEAEISWKEHVYNCSFNEALAWETLEVLLLQTSKKDPRDLVPYSVFRKRAKPAIGKRLVKKAYVAIDKKIDILLEDTKQTMNE